MWFFLYSPAVTQELDKVTNLFQIGLFPHKKIQICQFQHETGLYREEDALEMFS